MTTPLVTVLTPTYNRRELLPRLYRSIADQSYRDFEWVVVDDGSTDGTDELMAELTREADFPVRYFLRSHGGRHAAANFGVREARGLYCAGIDSDDWYTPDALERMVSHWEAMTEPERQRFASVEGLVGNPDGPGLKGSPLPAELLDSDTFDIRVRHKLKGDTRGMHRTEVLKAFPFPEDLGDVYVPEAVVWNRVAQRYRTRFVSEIFGYQERQPGGITAGGRALAVKSAKAYLLYHRELLQMGRPLPAALKVRALANVTRYAMHAREGLGRTLWRTKPRLLVLTAVPLGAALYLRDMIERRRAG